jgi:hypothetical protein
VVEVATVEGRVELGIKERRLRQSVKLTGLKVFVCIHLYIDAMHAMGGFRNGPLQRH